MADFNVKEKRMGVDAPPPRPPTPPQIACIDRALAVLPLLVLAIVLVLLLAGCKGDDRPRTGNKVVSDAISAPAQAQEPTPAPVQAAPANEATPGTNGVVPPPTPVLIWCDSNTPNCEPTPEFGRAKYPCATNQEIDAWLQGGQ